MASMRRLISYDDVDYGSPSSSSAALASTSMPPPTSPTNRQRPTTPHIQAATSIADSLDSASNGRGLSPTSSTNEESLSYAKKKRLRRKRALQSKQAQGQAASSPVNATPEATVAQAGGEEAEGGTLSQSQGIKAGKKRRRNEDNRVQRASLRQQMEGQWSVNGAALEGLDYDGLATESGQIASSSASSSKEARNGRDEFKFHNSTSLPLSARWKDQQGDDGWGNDGGHQDPNDEYSRYEAYDEDEDYDEHEDYDESIQAEWDAMAKLNTSIAIPDIPAAFVEGEEGAHLDSEMAEQSTGADPMPVADGSRVLTEQELWHEMALVDAWNAASEEYSAFTKKGQSSSTHPPRRQPSALWHDAPAPGSKAALRAQQASANNKVKRALRLFTEGEARKAMEIESLRSEVETEQAQAQAQQEKEESQTEAGAVATTTQVGSTAIDPVASSSSPTTSMPKTYPVGLRSLTGRAIPPSIGLPGNAAWQAACATVASTRNRIGAEVIVLPKGSNSKTMACADSARVEAPPMLQQQNSTVNQNTPPAISFDTPSSSQVPTSAPLPTFASSSNHSHTEANGCLGALSEQRCQPRPTNDNSSTSSCPPWAATPTARATHLLAPAPAPPLLPAGIKEGLSSAPFASHVPGNTSESADRGELLQRVCSSWYYAGYWTAQWEEEGRRNGRREQQMDQGRDEQESQEKGV